MEKKILVASEEWYCWHEKMVTAWGWSSRVRSAGNQIAPAEYPCLLVYNNDLDENGNGYTEYDFIYKSDVIGLF